MHATSHTGRNAFAVVKVVAMAVLLGTIGGAFILLERDRSRGLIAEEVELWRTEDDRIRGVRFSTREVTPEHWALLDDATDSLWHVNLSKTTHVAGGLASLARFPEIRDLRLAHCHWVDDAQVAQIAKMHQLQSLDISGTSISDRGMRDFELTELNSLVANGCQGLAAESFELLGTLPRLMAVSLARTTINFDQYERLRTARPNLILTAEPQVSWEFVDSADPGTSPVNWLTDQTDADQFVRYWNLRFGMRSRSSDETTSTRILSLGGPGVADKLAGILTQLHDFEVLRFIDTRLTGGLEHIPPSVESLTLINLHAGTQLDGIRKVNWLTSIFVRDVELTTEQWSEFAAMLAVSQSLVGVNISGAEFPTGALQVLRHHSELQYLTLSNCQVSDADLQAIGQIKSLEILAIAGIPISDVVARSWLDLPKLNFLSIDGGSVSPVAAGRLYERYPNAQIRIH